jgi:predicted dehydrogenase/threonine dehydrogenase-like Zn-dependent dehydrogenase
MKQVLQNFKTGELQVADVPPPVIQPGRVLVRAAASLISAGTERMKVDLAKKSLLGKAKERPDLVRQVIQKAKNEGLMNTLTAVRAKLEALVPLGYSASGVVVGVGAGVEGFSIGDRVACAGAGYAAHAELLSVPQNLCVQLPEGCDFTAGAYGTLGAIALQGVRLAEPTLGEACVVIGLGLLGQLTAQLLKANGCRVFGVDLDESKIALAQTFGLDAGATPAAAKQKILDWTRGRGADAVLITAATSSNDPIELAGEVARLKGRVVAVGLVGMDVPREAYYLRELTLRVSMSYGPGRYDPAYEEQGHDYPFAYVRWTEQRNIEAFLDLAASGRVSVEKLTTHRFPIEEGEAAYKLVSGETKEPYLGIVLTYDTERELSPRIPLKPAQTAPRRSLSVSFLGAGSYAQKFLLPEFKAAGVEFAAIATASGVTARSVGEKYGFRECVAGADEILAENAPLVVIATRHDAHAELARRALEAGKHVFVEKPLALNDNELDAVLAAANNSSGRLMVGFNRRFSPHARQAREFFAGRQTPLSINYRVNAGRIPATHWIQDPQAGGGRIVGEVCHFIDLVHFLTGSLTARVFAEAVQARHAEIKDADSVFITLRLADGSNASIAYLAEGDKSLAKERVEIFGEGKTLILDDFRSVTAYHNGRAKTSKTATQDKGQHEEVRTVCEMVTTGGPAPIALADLAATTRATFRVLDSLRNGQAMQV